MDQKQFILYVDILGAQKDDVIDALKDAAREIFKCSIEKHQENFDRLPGEFVYSGVLYGKYDDRIFNVGALIQKTSDGLTLILRSVGCADVYDVTENCNYYTGLLVVKVIAYYITEIFKVKSTDEQYFN